MLNRLYFILMILFVMCSTGCVERTIKITSTPPGALVFLNDQEVGRTPCQTNFSYYGTYDVRLVLDDHEPYMGPGQADMPLYDIPPIDLVAEILPVRFHSVVEWHFDLYEISLNSADIADRASQLRAKLGVTPVAADDDSEPDDVSDELPTEETAEDEESAISTEEDK